jgi:hypothetical protein
VTNYIHSLPTCTVLRNLPLPSPHAFITRCLCIAVILALTLFRQGLECGRIKYNNVHKNTEEFESKRLFRVFASTQISRADLEDLLFTTL